MGEVLHRQIVAQLADRNSDGHLSAGEYVNSVKGIINRATLDAIATDDPRALAFLQRLSSQDLSKSYASFAREYSPLFPRGMEQPTNDQFTQLSLEARNAFIHASCPERTDDHWMAMVDLIAAQWQIQNAYIDAEAEFELRHRSKRVVKSAAPVIY